MLVDEAVVGAGGVERALPFADLVALCLGQIFEPKRRLNSAGDVVRPLHRAGEPEEVVGGAREHRRSGLAFQVVYDPGVLGPAALAGIDDQRTLLQRNAGEAARHDADAVCAREHERPQIHMARRNAALERGWAGRQRQRRLGDVVVRVGHDLGPELLALGGA